MLLPRCVAIDAVRNQTLCAGTDGRRPRTWVAQPLSTLFSLDSLSFIETRGAMQSQISRFSFWALSPELRGDPRMSGTVRRPRRGAVRRAGYDV